MKHTRGATIKKGNKGFTLVEVTTAIAIMSILMTVILLVVAYFIKEFKTAATENREAFYINEALRFIENEILSGNKEVKLQENVIELRRFSEDRIDYIRQSENNLVIEYSIAGRIVTVNVFLKNILDFNIEKYGRLVIVNIVSSKGEVHSKCINMAYVK